MKSLILLTFLASSLAFAETKSIAVKGMTCGSCVSNVKKAVCDGLGYPKENCKVEIGKVTVTNDHLDIPKIEAAITKAGYEVAAAGEIVSATEQKSCHGDGKSCADHKADHSGHDAEAKPATTAKKKK